MVTAVVLEGGPVQRIPLIGTGSAQRRMDDSQRRMDDRRGAGFLSALLELRGQIGILLLQRVQAGFLLSVLINQVRDSNEENEKDQVFHRLAV